MPLAVTIPCLVKDEIGFFWRADPQSPAETERCCPAPSETDEHARWDSVVAQRNSLFHVAQLEHKDWRRRKMPSIGMSNFGIAFFLSFLEATFFSFFTAGNERGTSTLPDWVSVEYRSANHNGIGLHVI